jgi:heat shock protein HtpX
MSINTRVSFHDQITKNKWKSFILMIIIITVFLLIGGVIGLSMGPDYFMTISIIAIIISILYVWIGYYNSDKIALASVNAKIADEISYRQYHNIVEGLCLASGMPKPRLYIMNDNNINAFATGRDPKHAVICVTTGALLKLDKQELEGVLSHELSHIAHYDIRFMTLTAVMVGMIAIISEVFLRSLFWGGVSNGDNDNNKGSKIIFIIIGIVLAIIAPLVVHLVQLAISRKREYAADASAVKFIRSPTGLIKALKKIKTDYNMPPDKKINHAIAPLFISDPFKKKIENIFSTHPSLEKRIEILEKM